MNEFNKNKKVLIIVMVAVTFSIPAIIGTYLVILAIADIIR